MIVKRGCTGNPQVDFKREGRDNVLPLTVLLLFFILLICFGNGVDEVAERQSYRLRSGWEGEFERFYVRE